MTVWKMARNTSENAKTTALCCIVPKDIIEKTKGNREDHMTEQNSKKKFLKYLDQEQNDS